MLKPVQSQKRLREEVQRSSSDNRQIRLLEYRILGDNSMRKSIRNQKIMFALSNKRKIDENPVQIWLGYQKQKIAKYNKSMGISMSESDEMRRLQFLHQQPHYIIAITENRQILQLKPPSNESAPRQSRATEPSKVRISPQEPTFAPEGKLQQGGSFQLLDAQTVTEMQLMQKPMERQKSNKLPSQSKQNYEEDDLVKWSKSQLRESRDNRNINSELRARKVKIVKN